MFRFVVEIHRLAGAEFLSPRLGRQRIPVGARCFERPFDERVADASLTEIKANTDRTLALTDTRLYEVFRKSLITLQSICAERLDNIFGNLATIAFACKFFYEFGLPVFATGQKNPSLFCALLSRKKNDLPPNPKEDR